MKVLCQNANNLMVSPETLAIDTDSLENNLKKVFKMCLKKISSIENKTDDVSVHEGEDTICGPENPVMSIIKPQEHDKPQSNIVVYPYTDLKDILSIMNAMNLKLISVVKHPWNPQILGQLEKKDVQEAVKNKKS